MAAMNIDDWFGFTLRERKGIAFLIGLILTVFLVGELWPENPDNNHVDLSAYLFPSDTLKDNDQLEMDANQMTQDLILGDGGKKIKYQRFKFDPNMISYDSLLLLGFSKFGAKSLTNFISKGGKIYDVTKFKTIYGIDTVLVNQLSGLITYPVKPAKPEYPKPSYTKIEAPELPHGSIELNTADSSQFAALKILGRYNAVKIINFRKRAGGFMKKEQLVEFEVISDSLYQIVESYLYADPSKIRKINLNTADYRTFIKHPYFDKETISKILKYRQQHGAFTDVRHIRRIKSLNEEVGERIIPYLMVE